MELLLGFLDYVTYGKGTYIRVGRFRTKITIFYVLMFLVLLLAAFFRNPYYGVDTQYYIIAYDRIAQGIIVPYEYAYTILERICSYIHLDYQGFIRVIAILVYSFLFLSYKERKERFFIILSYIAMNYFDSYSILRNYLACSFLLEAYHMYKNENKRGAAFFAILACLFHNTSFIFITLLLFSKKKTNSIYWLIVCSVMFIIERTRVYSFIYSFIGKVISGRYLVYAEKTPHVSTVYVALLTLALILYYICRGKLQDDVENRMLSNFMGYIAVFTVFCSWFPNYDRIIRVSFVFIAIIVSKMLYSMNKKNQYIIGTVYTISLFVAMFLNQGFFALSGMFM